MDSQKEELKIKLKELEYLQDINEDLIWNSYKKIVPYAQKEVMTDSVQIETLQMLGRFSGRLFLDIQEERKEPSHLVPIVETVSREEFD